MNFVKICTFVFVVLFNATLHATVTIQWAVVGNPGNAPDTRFSNSLGSVNCIYQIGKYEITAGQYTEFLNAVAKDDPSALYSPSMAFGTSASIQQSGSAPNYSYSVAVDWENRAVSAVSFWNAARFANWLHNGQPTGAQSPGTTADGAYHDVGNQLLFGRNTGAKFFIPTENEWYKAAYHNRAAGIAASYFDYPTGKNSFPGNNPNETTNPGNNANYSGADYAIGRPYFRTVVGEFELSVSPYGTFDQGGNVEEWNETIMLGSYRGFRGGDWGLNAFFMYAGSGFNYLDPANDYAGGFRLAALVPEPNALMVSTNRHLPLDNRTSSLVLRF